MSQFSVKPEMMKSYTDLHSIGKDVKKISSAVDKVACDLGYEIASSAAIRSRLHGIADDVSDYEKSVKSLRDALNNAVERYKTAEQKVYTNAGGKGSAISAAWTQCTTDEKKKEKESYFKWSDVGHLVLKSFGVAGGFISTTAKFVTGDKGEVSTWAKFVSGAMKGGEKLTKVVKASGKTVSAKWKEIFGINIKKIDSKSFGANMNDELGKVTKLSAAASVISSFADNYDEFKDSKNWGRMAQETVVEAGVDIVKGAVIGAAVSTVLAGAALPAVAVGVVTAGVAWGADLICKKITGGRTVNDVVGDFVIDTVKNKISTKKKVVKAAAKKIKAAWTGLFGGSGGGGGGAW